MTCDYAGCGNPAVTSDAGWSFCRPCYYLHLAELREKAAKDCARCSLPFVSTNPRRTHCNTCRRKDTRPTHKRRSA